MLVSFFVRTLPGMREHALLVLIFYFLVVADVERLFVSPMTIHISFLRNISLGLLPLFQLSVCSVAMGCPSSLLCWKLVSCQKSALHSVGCLRPMDHFLCVEAF